MILSTYNSSETKVNASQLPDAYQDNKSDLLVNSKTEQLVFQHQLNHQLIEIEHCCLTERAASLLDVSSETLNRTKREGRDFYERANWIAYPIQEVDETLQQPIRRKQNFWRVFFRVIPNEQN
jgi:hypothetical protein